MEDITATLRQIFVETLRLPTAPTLLGEKDLVTQLGIDSIALMEIITRVEHTFHITVDEEDISPTLVNSLETLARYIHTKRGQ